MMMSLGLFVFSVPTVAYQQFQRDTAERFAANDRFGARAASQHLGPGADTISLTGDLYPGTTGGSADIQRLLDMQATGTAYLLMDGQGNVLGYWTIRSVQQNRSIFLREGQARKMSFTLTLSHEPDDTLNKADLTPEDLAIARLAGNIQRGGA